MPRQHHLPHHPDILLSRQQRTGVNEVHGYKVLHPAILLSPAFPGGLSLDSCIVDPSEAQHMSQMHYFCLLDEKSSSRKLSYRQGESELLLLAAQSILYAIYHSLTFFFGELFYRLDRDINRDVRFVAYHPAVVPRLDHVCIARTKIYLCAIVHNDLKLTRNYVPSVAHLAAIGLRNGPHMLGPLPSWLKNLSGDFKVLDGSGLHLAVFGFPCFNRGVHSLFLTA